MIKGDPYFEHLAALPARHGMDMPFFMSGLRHGSNPAPNAALSPESSSTPWYTTEFWAGWFDAYRTLPRKKNAAIDDAVWKNISRGAGGYNIYMIHGGSNFANWSDNSTGASYDYGAAIGQTGDLRPMYYRMKRVNQLGLGFPDIIADSEEAGGFTDFASGAGLEFLGARRSRSGCGTLVFLRNRQNEDTSAMLRDGGAVRLARTSTCAFPVDVQLSPGVRLVSSTLPVLTRTNHEGVVSVVFFGQPGEAGEIVISAKSAPGGRMTRRLTVPAKGVAEDTLSNIAPGLDLRLLAVPQDLTFHTWVLGARDRQSLVFGPAFVRSVEERDGRPVSVLLERFSGTPAPGRVVVYGARGPAAHFSAPANPALEAAAPPKLGAWTMSPTREADPAFDDRAWLKSARPLQLGADGDYGNFGWYRTEVDVPAPGTGTLRFKFKDDVVVFVNGTRLPEPTSPARFQAGKNTIAILAAHIGRNKGYNFLGDLSTHDMKGITSEVVMNINGQQQTLAGWRMRGGLGAAPAEIKNWHPLGDTAGRPTFYRTTFDAPPPAATGVTPILRVTYAGLGRGMVWLNGRALARYPEKIRINSLYLPETWLKPGGNELVVFDETGASPSAVTLVVEKESSREVMRASKPIDPSVPIIVPPEFPVRDLAGLNTGNLAYLARAAASTAADDAPAAYATDGDTDTVWTAARNEKNGRLKIDLGSAQTIAVVEILWAAEQKHYRYTLEGSVDEATWTKLGDHTTAVPTSPDSPSELSRLNLPGPRVRHLRVTIEENRNVGIAEIRAFP